MSDSREGAADDSDGEWRFSLEDLEDDEATDAGRESVERPPLEPERVSAENALFVLVGVVGTILLLFFGI
jgi:hypothetical protein